jgi:hypothetical protein
VRISEQPTEAAKLMFEDSKPDKRSKQYVFCPGGTGKSGNSKALEFHRLLPRSVSERMGKKDETK